MSDLRILFGVGATKAGTSWLHEWLSGHPECHFRTMKEVHFFNHADSGRAEKRIAELVAERHWLAERGASARRLRDIDDCIELFRRADAPGVYMDYLTAGRGAKEVVGDITPAYALLPVPRLAEMAGLGETRFVYILRDPVARLWSHVRMIAGRREPDGSVTADRAARILKRTLRGDEDHIAMRGDYRGAIERLKAAVPAAQRLVVFFEDLFTGKATARICDFLDIAPHPPLAEVAHGGQPLEMTPDQYRAARDWLGGQYDFVEGAMGRLPAAWTRMETAR